MKREKVESLEDARNQIDAIDDALIELIAKRQFYVDQVIRFKRKSEDVKSPRIEKVCAQASEQGLDRDLIENIYREMIQHFIRRELKEIRP